MRPFLKSNRLIVAALALLAVLGLAAMFVPWKPVVESRLAQMLQAKGFDRASFSISHVGLTGATLENVTLGDGGLPVLRRVTAGYTLRDLWRGTLDDLTLSGLNVSVRGQDGKWLVSGFTPAPGAPGRAFSIPATPEELARIPFRRVVLEDGRLDISSPAWNLSLPFAMEWDNRDAPALSAASPGAGFRMNDIDVATGAVNITDMTLADGVWRGKWSAADIRVAGAALDVPVLQGGGTLELTSGEVKLEGAIFSVDKTYSAAFSFIYDLRDPSRAAFTLVSAAMPWKQGRLSASGVRIPLTGTAPITVSLAVKGVSVDELLQALTGKRVSATGAVSGTVPVVIGRDGSLDFRPADLRADGDGVISMPPDAIPGDNQQIELVRQVLKELHYTSLSVSLRNGEAGNGGFAVLLALEGSNPDVYDGRIVKLNVNLTGDVLDFIRQNVIFFTKPETLLKQGDR